MNNDGTAGSIRVIKRRYTHTAAPQRTQAPAQSQARNAAVRDTAVVRGATVRTPAANRNVTAPLSRPLARNNGFVYVEHCGVRGTIRDVFFTKKVRTKSKSCFDKVVTVVVFAVLLFFLAGSYCEYLNTFNEIKHLETQISQCKEDQTKLIVALEKRDDLSVIESIAVNDLGMVRSDDLTRHYINISEKDVVTLKEGRPDPAAPQGVLLSGFRNILANLIG